MSEDAVNAILELVVESDGCKKLTCADAFKVSKEHRVSLAEIGDYCDASGIKLFDCQLGCF